jgi:hypothetical protein
MPTIFPSSTGAVPIGQPITVTMPGAEACCGLSRTKLRTAITDGLSLPDGTKFRVAAVKAGSTTLVMVDKPVERAGAELLVGGLRQLVELLPPYTGAPTPESRKMIETRKREAAKQRAARALTAAE